MEDSFLMSKTSALLIEVNEKFVKQKNSCDQYLKKLGFDLKEKKRNDLLKNTDFSSSYNQIWVK
jgi:hypothetical protein|tara:strand:+ start:939 stop:1130 length:192 start_codon:yes stop_codon:yes gene_type:complete